MPAHLDDRYLNDPEELDPQPVLTPEAYRAYVQNGGIETPEQLGHLLDLRQGDVSWAFFTQEVIDFWNNFQHGIPIQGPGLVKLKYNPRKSAIDLSDEKIVEERWELRKEISPEALCVHSDTDTSSEVRHLLASARGL